MKFSGRLARRGQLDKSRKVATAALLEYGLHNARLSLLSHDHNTIFRVRSTSGWHGVLRICRQGKRTLAELNSELMWLDALRRDTTLIVPRLILALNGNRICTFHVPEPCFCILFEWLDGRFRNTSLTASHLRSVGRFMAQLHKHAETFATPVNFTRPRLLLDGEVDILIREALKSPVERLAREERKVFQRAFDRLQKIIADLVRDKSQLVLIHADIYQRNYLFDQEGLRLIDFDDCGYGHVLYDMAVSLWHIRKHPDIRKKREGFLEGYRECRAFPAKQEVYLEAFVALRALLMGAVAVVHADSPAIQAWGRDFRSGVLREMATFIHT